MTVVSLTSLTRISDLATNPYDVGRIDREQWDSGDYVAGEITGAQHRVYGTRTCVGPNGAGVAGRSLSSARSATGPRRWRALAAGPTFRASKMHAMTSAGLFGAVTSMSLLDSAHAEPDLPRDMSSETARKSACQTSPSGLKTATSTFRPYFWLEHPCRQEKQRRAG